MKVSAETCNADLHAIKASSITLNLSSLSQISCETAITLHWWRRLTGVSCKWNVSFPFCTFILQQIDDLESRNRWKQLINQAKKCWARATSTQPPFATLPLFFEKISYVMFIYFKYLPFNWFGYFGDVWPFVEFQFKITMLTHADNKVSEMVSSSHICISIKKF